MEEKNKRTNIDLGQHQAPQGGSLCDTVQSVIYRERVLERNSHKPLTMLTSVDCVLLWSVISSRLFSSAFLYQLTLSVFSGTFRPSSTSGLVGDLALRSFVWVSHENRQKDSLSGANTNGNKLLRIVSQWIKYKDLKIIYTS